MASTAHPKSLTPTQAALARRVFAHLKKEFGSQEAIAAKLNINQSSVNRAMKGATGIYTLTKAAQLAGFDPLELETVGIPVIRQAEGEDMSTSDIILRAARHDRISEDAIATWFRQRGATGLGDVRVGEAILQMQRIMLDGRPVALGSSSAVDDLLESSTVDERPQKRRR